MSLLMRAPLDAGSPDLAGETTEAAVGFPGDRRWSIIPVATPAVKDLACASSPSASSRPRNASPGPKAARSA
jgi:hypothetical protein